MAEGNVSAASNGVENLTAQLRILKRELATLDPNSAKFAELATQVGEVKDKMNDAAEAMNANAGSAFERLQNNAGLLKERLFNMDFDGVTSSVKGLATSVKSVSFKEMITGIGGMISAMAQLAVAIVSNPFLLLAGVITAIAYNFKDLKAWVRDASGEIARMAELTNDLNNAMDAQYKEQSKSIAQIEVLTGKVTDHTLSEKERRNALKLLSEMYPEYFKNIKGDINDTDALTAAKTALIKKITEEAKANAAKSLLEAEYAKKLAAERAVNDAKSRMSAEDFAEAVEDARDNSQTLFKETNQAISEWINGTDNAGAAALQLEKSLKNIAYLEGIAAQAVVDGAEKEVIAKKKVEDSHKKTNKEKKKSDEEIQAEKKKSDDEYYEWSRKGLNTFLDEKNKTEVDALINSIKTTEPILKEWHGTQLKLSKEEVEANKLLQKEKYAAQVQLASDAVGSLMALNDAFANGSEKSAKRAFQINKALSLAQAIMSTYQAVNAQLAVPQDAITGANYVKAGISLAMGLANVVKISKTQFNSSSAGGGGGAGSASGGGGSLGSGGGGGSMTSVTPSFNPLNTSFLNNRPAQTGAVQAYVLSSNVSSAMEANQKVKDQTVL
jgi:hypothetical protein